MSTYISELVTRYLDVCVSSAQAGTEFLAVEIANYNGVPAVAFIARGETVQFRNGDIKTDHAFAEHMA